MYLLKIKVSENGGRRMTNEKVMEILNVVLKTERAYQYRKEEVNEAFDIAIKALEQESVLDKIRAEIKAMSGDIETIADVLAIIDKHKAESEE